MYYDTSHTLYNHNMSKTFNYYLIFEYNIRTHYSNTVFEHANLSKAAQQRSQFVAHHAALICWVQTLAQSRALKLSQLRKNISEKGEKYL